jgi:Uma2 family endonuclease
VREYWLVDPDLCAIDIYALRGHAYALLGSFGQADQTRSEVLPDFTFLVSNICQPLQTS